MSPLHLAAGLLLLARTVPAAPPPLLYAPFDGAAQAQWAPGGTLTPATSMSGPFLEGVRGQARRLGGNNTAVYYVDRSFLPPRGTCSLWVKPLDWTPGTADHFVFFTSFNYTGVEGAYVRVILYKIFNETNLALLFQSSLGGEKSAVVRTPIEFWRRGQWHHLAFTWDPERFRLQVDGRPVGEAKTVPLPETGRWEIMVGTPYEGWAYLGTETNAIDEFTIWSEVLPAEEITRMYDEIAPGLPPPPADLAEDAAGKRTDLALRRNGALVLASSFRDFTTCYPDSLIDGNDETCWRPFEPELPQWLELRWPLPVRVSEIALRPEKAGTVTACSVHAWSAGSGEWRRLEATTEASAATVALKVPETQTQRLRVVIEQADAQTLGLCALSVYGPPQPLLTRLKPYWKAAYIWYPEPDQVYKPNQPRYFRRTFDVADPALVRSAILQLRSNDSYRAWLNGAEVASGSTNIAPVPVGERLVKGRNVLAIEADLHSNPGRWGWGELIFELALNQDDHTDYVSSDEQTLTSAAKEDGWLAPDFDAGKWWPAARFVSPPEGVWGEIPYYATPVAEKATLEGFRLLPPTPHPGETVTAEVALRPRAPVRDDFFFVFEAGAEAVRPDLDSFELVSVPLLPEKPSSGWQRDQPQTLSFRFELPAWAPEGSLPVRLKAYGTNHGGALELTDRAGAPLKLVGQLPVARAGMTIPAPALPKLTVAPGAAALQRGGETAPPVFWALAAHSWERYQLYGGTGVHAYHVGSTPIKLDDTPETLASVQAFLDQRIASALRVDPQAQFIVNVELRPSAAWLDAHPQERLVTAQGALGPVSYCSAVHFASVDRFLRGLIGYLKSRPYAARVIGYLPMSCGAPDSTMGGVESDLFQRDRSKVTVGDWSPQAVAAFREWLRAKYGSAARLRAAWHDPQATFEGVKLDIRELVREGAEGGVFRDPKDSGLTLDYFDFLSGVMGRFYSHVARTVKEAAGPQVLVGAYYGYNVGHLYGYNNPGSMFNGNNFDLYERLQDPNWDFFAGPIPYESRGAGLPFKSYHATASVLLHGKLLINELDHRTFVAGPTTYGRLHSPRETEGVLKRDLGGSIVDGSGHWFADWSSARGREGVGFFTDPSILKTVRDTTAAAARVLRQPKAGGAEVALFVHGGTMACQDIYRSEPIYYNLVARTVWEEMSRMGAPFDTYLLEDLADPRVRTGYRLYILLNPFLLSSRERRLIDDLKRDGKTLLFFYAPGYADREQGLADGNIAAVSGFRVSHMPVGEVMRYRISNASHPVTEGLPPGREYAVAPYDYELSRELHPAAFGPVFRIEDAGAGALAAYPDGKTALAARDFGQWQSVYCTVPYMAAEVLRGVCRYAGVHLYCRENLVLKADNRCLMVHHGHGQPREVTLHLPGERDVVDLCTGQPVASGVRSLQVRLEEGETRLLGLSPPGG